MIAFKILAERLPVKWQTELRQALAIDSPAAPPQKDGKPDAPATTIDVQAKDEAIVDVLVAWLRQMNRRMKSEKTFVGPGISLKIEKIGGMRIALNERNGVVVKQFLMK
jgi:hypothetical protein